MLQKCLLFLTVGLLSIFKDRGILGVTINNNNKKKKFSFIADL